jgi:hypothetical protein
VDGLLAEAGNAEDLANALQRFVRGEVNSEVMGDSGWHRQREEFLRSVHGNGRSLTVYRQVLAA